MAKLYVKKQEENDIYLAENRYYSPFWLFLKNNGKILFAITMLLAVSVFVIAFKVVMDNVKESKIVMYEKNGVEVTFDGTDNSILNGNPITKEYASKVFESNIYGDETGAVIKVKEVSFVLGKIVFYSDNTALIKYNDGSYVRVYSFNNDYGITEKGVINIKSTIKRLTGEEKENTSLGIKLIYLSDGSVEIIKGKTEVLLRNSDLTSLNDKFYTNLSNISVETRKEGNTIYYSNGTIKEADLIIVNNQRYNVKEVKNVTKDIKIIYYENGFAEIIKDNQNVLVEKSEHIIYDNHKLEIKNNNEKMNIKDLMDIKNITIKNTNNSTAKYLIILEETSNYSNHNIKRLNPNYIYYSLYVNGIINKDKVLGSSVLDNSQYNLNLTNTSYLLYEGTLSSFSEENFKLGMWIDYTDITNEYMNSGLIGTVKVYVESVNQ